MAIRNYNIAIATLNLISCFIKKLDYTLHTNYTYSHKYLQILITSPYTLEKLETVQKTSKLLLSDFNLNFNHAASVG